MTENLHELVQTSYASGFLDALIWIAANPKEAHRIGDDNAEPIDLAHNAAMLMSAYGPAHKGNRATMSRMTKLPLTFDSKEMT